MGRSSLCFCAEWPASDGGPGASVTVFSGGGGGGRLRGGGGGGGPMGGELPAEGGSEGAGDRVADRVVAGTSLAFSARRARLASRARLSSSPRRSVSITDATAGTDGVVGDCGGDATLLERDVEACFVPVPRRPRTRVQPPPESDPLTSPALVGEVCVSALVSTAAAGMGAPGAADSGGTPGPISFRPKDCSRDMSWLMFPCCCCPLSERSTDIPFATLAYDRLGWVAL